MKKSFKILLMLVGTFIIIGFHTLVMIKDCGFIFNIAIGFAVLHYINFDLFDRWIKKSNTVVN